MIALLLATVLAGPPLCAHAQEVPAIVTLTTWADPNTDLAQLGVAGSTEIIEVTEPASIVQLVIEARVAGEYIVWAGDYANPAAKRVRLFTVNGPAVVTVPLPGGYQLKPPVDLWMDGGVGRLTAWVVGPYTVIGVLSLICKNNCVIYSRKGNNHGSSYCQICPFSHRLPAHWRCANGAL